MKWNTNRVISIAAVLIVLSPGIAHADEKEDLFWGSVKKGNALEEYRLYVEQYPQGKYLGEAWRRIGQTEEAEKSALARRHSITIWHH